MGDKFYVVTDSSDFDPVYLKPGTLHYARHEKFIYPDEELISTARRFIYPQMPDNFPICHKERMGITMVVALLLLASLVSSGFALPPTGPAFLWSPRYEVSNDEVNGIVNYQTVSTKDLAKAVLSQGRWSEILCSKKKLKQQTNLALVFVGRELQSLDISRNKHVDPALLNLLEASYLNSNLSLAFPYVVASAGESMENSLLSGFAEACCHNIETISVAVVGSCSTEVDESHKITDLKSLHDYLVSRKERSVEGHGDVIMFCQGESASLNELGLPSSDEILSDLLRSMEQLEEKYSVLYVSDPLRSVQYPSIRELGRFLAEGSNGSSNSTTCDGVCQIKSSLLEGLLVGIVLLVILISGLCCMAGIQTPTKIRDTM